jgi:hypothetical protein
MIRNVYKNLTVSYKMHVERVPGNENLSENRSFKFQRNIIEAC